MPNGWTLNGDGHTITAYDPAGGHFRGAVVANEGSVANVHDLTITGYHLADVCDAGPTHCAASCSRVRAVCVANNHVVDLRQDAQRLPGGQRHRGAQRAVHQEGP